ncbi:MAG: NYN domain-containing protein [Terrimesophilobacter sp.]
MSDTTEGRVAVYIDFDNIIISRYQQVHGKGSFQRDGGRALSTNAAESPSDAVERMTLARVDLGAILDYASSFGTVAISRAYADWSVPMNANYKDQLVGRAVDLVQMFPTVQSMKNGADIRMSVDVVEDLFRLPEITHVVIVSGDSDFIALAQRCRRLGRYIVGIGVAGGTSRALNAACNEYKDYDGLPGLDSESDSDDDLEEMGVAAMAAPPEVKVPTTHADTANTKPAAKPMQATSPTPKTPSLAKSTAKAASATTAAAATKTAAKKTPPKAAAAKKQNGTATSADGSEAKASSQRAATKLLRRALELAQSKDAEWITSSSVKNQMLRMDPTFQESALGYTTFTNFVKSRGNIVEVREEGQLRLLKLRGE